MFKEIASNIILTDKIIKHGKFFSTEHFSNSKANWNVNKKNTFNSSESKNFLKRNGILYIYSQHKHVINFSAVLAESKN